MKARDNKYLIKVYQGELLHHYIYKSLASKEKDEEVKGILKKLSKTEEMHAELWKKIINIEKIKLGTFKAKPALIFTKMLRHLFGLTLLVNIIETIERNLYKRIDYISSNDFSEKEMTIFNQIKSDEMNNEKELEDELLKHNSVLNNIRDVIFGMNDGLVEVTAAVAGLASALHVSEYVLLGGIIIALSGTLSMAGGAFLSTGYENDLNIKRRDLKPKSSATYVGIAYLLGSMVPLIPFAFGLDGYYGVLFSLIFTGCVLSVSATLISIISYKSITKNILKTLMISFGAAFVTIILGYLARTLLHITI